MVEAYLYSGTKDEGDRSRLRSVIESPPSSTPASTDAGPGRRRRRAMRLEDAKRTSQLVDSYDKEVTRVR